MGVFLRRPVYYRWAEKDKGGLKTERVYPSIHRFLFFLSLIKMYKTLGYSLIKVYSLANYSLIKMLLQFPNKQLIL